MQGQTCVRNGHMTQPGQFRNETECLDFHREINTVFCCFGFLHDMQSEYTDDVSKVTVGSYDITGHEQ